ncbi:MAG: hydrogenase maturation nickel metallochaperone HypA [Nitrospiraceae bacterium]|nr:hydrogenase maturation nickel metallochaperone HypA [Nitrospiraceae bacterium]
MHELSLVMNLLELCEAEASRGSFDRIDRIVLEVGELSGVSLPALRFSFDVAARGSVTESAVLEIREIPGRGWCLKCEETVPIREPLRECPACGSPVLLPTGGTEFRLCELVVRDRRMLEKSGKGER